MCDVHNPSAPLRAVAVRLPQNERRCRRCERTCIPNAGKRCWLCCSVFYVLCELVGVPSDLGLPLLARDMMMHGVDVLLLTVGHCGCDASILTMMRRRYYSGDIHRQQKQHRNFEVRCWGYMVRYCGAGNFGSPGYKLNGK